MIDHDQLIAGTEPDEDTTTAPEHEIRMAAVVSLVLTPTGWAVEEDPTARLDRDEDLVCVNEGHMLNPAARAGCDLLKDNARNLPLPTAQHVAEAFLRAADHRRAQPA